MNAWIQCRPQNQARPSEASGLPQILGPHSPRFQASTQDSRMQASSCGPGSPQHPAISSGPRAKPAFTAPDYRLVPVDLGAQLNPGSRLIPVASGSSRTGVQAGCGRSQCQGQAPRTQAPGLPQRRGRTRSSERDRGGGAEVRGCFLGRPRFSWDL